MNTRWMVFSGVLSAVVLGSAVAYATVNPDGTWSLTRSNSKGTTFANIGDPEQSFCYLSTVELANGAADDGAECSVTRDDHAWTLKARLHEDNGLVRCRAYCYSRG